MSAAPVCLVSGGSPGVVGGLAAALPELRLVWLPPAEAPKAGRGGEPRAFEVGSADDVRSLAPRAHAWLHFIPSETGTQREVDLLMWALSAALDGLSAAQKSCFLAILPVDGLHHGDETIECEIASASARSALRRLVLPWSRRGLRLNVIEYGAVELRSVRPARPESVLVARTPMARLGTAQELARAILFLLSGTSSYVTGAVLRVDGGWGAYSWFYPAQEI